MVAFGEPIPTVSGVEPRIGPKAGGNTVTVTGADLGEASAVKFGTAEATSLTVNSPTSLTVTAPAGTGTVDVTVITPSGTSPAIAADRYTYQGPPTVVKLLPKSGPTAGGTIVTITGTEFTAATQVAFAGTAAAQFTVNSATSITATAPPGTAGAADVTVTNTAGTSAITTKDRFTYTPTVEAVTPNTGSTLGGTSVTVTGTGFALGSTATVFKFGKVKATSVNCTSATTCTMTAPPHEAGAVDVTALVSKATSPREPRRPVHLQLSCAPVRPAGAGRALAGVRVRSCSAAAR